MNRDSYEYYRSITQTPSRKEYKQWLKRRGLKEPKKPQKQSRAIGHVEDDFIIIHEHHAHYWPSEYQVQQHLFQETDVYIEETRLSRRVNPVPAPISYEQPQEPVQGA